ncbi:sigma-70 family RNA polymerase sigma factor [Gemmata sp. G18]|uniref:Sigma-70 family RNA polymerase sigma factor n=1 Tax=Gemmata palustris TaxID=2822762 RepID=A0ABS5BM44_9BACT|nr:sigma-70 family RNA polymerase sigma factor [Gemmata palustris]MBP3954789.1 sigma-70 family RNA polymerase sigma factor [Gemmata palustris]
MNISDASTDPALMRSLVGPASTAAWQVFVAQYTPLINERCRKAGLQPSDTDDVRQQVFMQLLKALDGFHYDPARRFRGYLSQAVDNALRSRWRVLGRRPEWVGFGGDIPEPLASLPSELDDLIRERLQNVWRVVERIRYEVGTEAWAAFWLTTVEGLPGEEAAERLGKKASAIYMSKSRVLTRLRDAVGASTPD